MVHIAHEALGQETRLVFGPKILEAYKYNRTSKRT